MKPWKRLVPFKRGPPPTSPCETRRRRHRLPELTSAGTRARVAGLPFAEINVGLPSPPETAANQQISYLTPRAASYRHLSFINAAITAEAPPPPTPPPAIRYVFKARRRVRFQSMLAWVHASTYMHTRAGTDAFFKRGNMIMNLA